MTQGLFLSIKHIHIDFALALFVIWMCGTLSLHSTNMVLHVVPEGEKLDKRVA